MLTILFWLIVISFAIGALFQAAGWGRPLMIVANFGARWCARGFILIVAFILVWAIFHMKPS